MRDPDLRYLGDKIRVIKKKVQLTTFTTVDIEHWMSDLYPKKLVGCCYLYHGFMNFEFALEPLRNDLDVRYLLETAQNETKVHLYFDHFVIDFP